MSTIKKDLVIIVSGRALQIIIMLISIRVLTSLLSPEEVGNYYLLLGVVTFFNLVFLNPPGMYFSRHIIQWEKSKDLLNALTVFFVWIVMTALIAVPLSFIIYYYLNYVQKFDLDVFLLYVVAAIVISTLHRNVLYGSNMLGLRKEFVLFLLITLLTGLVISSTIVYFWYKNSIGWALGIVLSETVLLLSVYKLFIQGNSFDYYKIRRVFSKERLYAIAKFCIPLGITTFLMWGQNTAYRFVVDYYYTAEVLGLIVIGIGISAAVFSSIESIAMQYFNPVFYKKILDADKKERAEAWNDIAKKIVPIYLMLLFFTIAISELLVMILVDQKFHSSYIYVMVGAFIEFFRVMTNLLNLVSQSEYKTTKTIVPYGLGFTLAMGVIVGVDFGTNYFMIPLVLAGAYSIVFFTMLVSMKKVSEIEYELGLFRIILMSCPFFSIKLFDTTVLSIYEVFLIVSLYSVYFLCAVWFLFRYERGKEVL